MADSPSSGYAECAIFPLAVSSNAQHALGRGGNFVFRGLPIDQEAAAQWIFIRDFRALAVALFTNKKQHSHRPAFFAQTLACGDLRRDDALGIARAATVNVVMVF